MYKKQFITETKIIGKKERIIGESIETKCMRITTQNEPITDGAPLIYTERNEGVQKGYDIRTDRFEVAVEAMDTVTKSNLAKRENKATMQIVKDDNVSGAEPIQGTKAE